MSQKPKRETVDLSQYPNLVMILLGMRVNTLTGVKTLAGFGQKISASVEARPDGLLHHEVFLFTLRHLGIRQYWRDFESLETWSRSEPHRAWWQNFLRDSGGTGFWHETYFRLGGLEAIYVDMKKPIGLAAFVPVSQARGPMFSARTRAGQAGEETTKTIEREDEFYSS
jgi:hypothetical protein